MLKFSAMMTFAILLFLIVGYFGRYGPAQRHFIQSNVVITIAGQTDDNLIPFLENHDSLVIQLGTGGSVDGMLQTVQYLGLHPEKTVVINGECYSACTMLLGAADNVLLTYNARLFFHSGYSEVCHDGIVRKLLSPESNRKMYLLFNDEQRDWIVNSGAFTSSDFVEMPKPLIREFYWKQWMSTDYMPPRDEASLAKIRGEASDRPRPCGPMRVIPSL